MDFHMSSDLLSGPTPWPLQPSNELPLGDEDTDIFRGNLSPRAPLSPVSIGLSSSDASLLGGRFTAIAAIVELAILRWARVSSSSSSSSFDNASLRSSTMSFSRPRTGRRFRRPSSVNIRCLPSERDLAAKYRAREKSRQIAREFVLYLPPSLHFRDAVAKPVIGSGSKSQAPPQRILRTSSLPLILAQLDVALKTFTKTQYARPLSPEVSSPHPASLYQDYVFPDPILPSCPESFTDQGMLRTRKGKARQMSMRPPMPEVANRAPKAWWLDVSSPTWEDMRAIGKLLHIHPLTLEDVLQQDPREKLELFPRLGYYFVSFRAIESQTTRESFRRYNADYSGHQDDGGVVGEANIYLIVFREGVCSFHFTDIAEHTNRVRDRLALLEETVNMSSDWIAHGILDSVVDSFFPFLEEVEKEVIEVEKIVFSGDPKTSQTLNPQMTVSKVSPQTNTRVTDMDVDFLEKLGVSVDEKSQPNFVRTRFSLPRLTIPLFVRRLKRAILSISIPISLSIEVPKAARNSTAPKLRRMARTRRLVTSLARLLATKSEVVAQIRKRLLTTGQSGLGNGAGKDDDIEVAIYMGDVQDHILTLQHSLAHYERMLSQSHPTYLSQLRLTVVQTKSDQDKAVMLLTIVTVAVLCIQPMIGVFSINCTVPTNVKEPYGRYDVFGLVLVLVLVISGVYLWVVRRWWLHSKAKKRLEAML